MSPVTRRGALSLIPAAVASLAAPVAVSAAIVTDPIFAAMAEMKAASERHEAVWSQWDEAPRQRQNDPEWEMRRNAAFDDWETKAMAMAATMPTTLKGLTALLEMLGEDIEAGDSIWQLSAVRSATAAAQHLVGGEVAL